MKKFLSLIALCVVLLVASPVFAECVPSWTCGEWTVCLPSGLQARTCADLNHCNTLTNKPAETQQCSVAQQSTSYGTQSASALDAQIASLQTQLAGLQSQLGGLLYQNPGVTTTVLPTQTTTYNPALTSLTTQLQQLQSQLGGYQGPTAAALATTIECPTLSRALSRDMFGNDIMSLQQFLIRSQFLAGDNVTGYYGPLTEAAVKKMQAAWGVVSSGDAGTTGYGAVGPKTRAAIAGRCGGPAAVQYTPNVSVVNEFTASPTTVFYGQNSQLTWNISNAGSCTLTQQTAGRAAYVISSSLPLNGNAIVTPLGTTVYTLLCTSIGSEGAGLLRSVTVTVNGAPPEVTVTSTTTQSEAPVTPKVTLLAVPATVFVGDTMTLNWSSVKMKSCTVTSSPAQYTSNALSGQQPMKFVSEGETRFSMSCIGEDGGIYATSTKVITNKRS